MKTEYDTWPTQIFEPKTAISIMPRIARLALAVFIALVAMVSLWGRLSATGRQVQGSHNTVMTTARDVTPCSFSSAADDVPARCRRPALSVTKRIDPTDPETGGMVTITFFITGLGLKQVDVVLVQDVSGSMSKTDTISRETRLKVAKDAAKVFVDELNDVDRVAVVAYNDETELNPPLTTDSSVVKNAIDSLTAGGYTNIGAGILAGYEELINSSRYNPKTVKAMILLSDGWANKPDEPGDDPANYARNQAETAGECGILIYTIGFGEGVSETLMRDIAALGGGQPYFSADGTDLETIYQEIALALRNLVITDILPPGVVVNCALFPAGMCSQKDGLTTTIVFSPSNEALMTDPLTLSFTATVNLDPLYVGPINASGSEICYDGPGRPPCQPFENPTATVGGRKITGFAFEDLDGDGYFDAVENILSGVVVTTSNALTSVTDSNGVYIFRTSAEPTLTVAISVPAHYLTTTSEITYVPPLSGTYERNFGLYTVPLLRLTASAQVVRRGTEVIYTYTVSNISAFATFTDVIVKDSHLGLISPTHLSLQPGGLEALTAPDTLTLNRTNRATVTSGIEGCSRIISGGVATTTVHVIEGISLSQIYTEPPTLYHGDTVTLYYTVTNRDVDNWVVSGTVLIMGSPTYTLNPVHFDKLGPAAKISLSSPPFSIPRDTIITLTAIATDDIQRILSVGDLVTLPLCPEDIYEKKKYDNQEPPPRCNGREEDQVDISPYDPRQLHDFSKEEDVDWVCFSTNEVNKFYTFVAHPLSPAGVAISLTLFDPATHKYLSESNLGDETSDVWLSVQIASNFGLHPLHVLDTYDYHLQVKSAIGRSGCWTDYELWVQEGLPVRIWLPVILRSS
jgi:hypothetical protein